MPMGTEKLRRGVFHKISGIEKFMDKRGGGDHDFLSKIFCLTVPKKSVAEPFSAVFQKIPRSEKVYG